MKKRFIPARITRMSIHPRIAWLPLLGRTLFALIGSLALGMAAERPNVILILTDDQSPRNPPTPEYPNLVVPPGFGYGGDPALTPHVDRMAREGMVMTNANVACPVCSPSRYTTLTGRHATRTKGEVFNRLFPAGTMGRPENNIEFGRGEPNLPRLLQAAGYTTAWVGKSHLLEQDILHKPKLWGTAAAPGLKAYPLDSDPRTNPKTNQAMRDNQQWWRERIRKEGFDWVGAVYPGNLLELYNKPSNVHNIEWTTRSVLDFLASRSPGDEPFFLYYGTTIPHGPDPWTTRNGRQIFSLDADPGYTGEGYRTDLDYSFMPSRASIKKEVRAAGLDEKHAWITWFDHSIGAILRKLDERGLAENTLVIISSDHGTWRYGKTTPYDGGLKVPLVMRWPAGIRPGSTYPHLVLNTDYAATILDLAGVKKPADYRLDGVSLAPVLRGKESGPLRGETFHEIGYARAIKTPEWKYIAVRYPPAIQRKIAAGGKFPAFKKNAPPNPKPYHTANSHLGYNSSKHNPHYFEADQLFDLKNDPQEKTNVIGRHPEVAADLKARLSEHLKTFPGRPFGEFTR
jgi:arylsulfatase A-like enzyme